MIGLGEALDLNFEKKEMVAIVGAGGKTTLMFALAREAKRANKKVLVTTTTAIYYPKEHQIDKIIVLDEDDFNKAGMQEGTITVLGDRVSKSGKLLGVDPQRVNEIYRKRQFDLIIVEADGAKRKPIKAPANHEPVIPSDTTKVVGVIGLDALDMMIDDKHVHRPHILSSITGVKMNVPITEKVIEKLILSPKGLFKGVLDHQDKYVMLNKTDNIYRQRVGFNLSQRLVKKDCGIEGIVISSLLTKFIKRVK